MKTCFVVMKTEFESLVTRNGGLHRMHRSDEGFENKKKVVRDSCLVSERRVNHLVNPHPKKTKGTKS